MQKTVIWHIGAHKCATTSFQTALSEECKKHEDVLLIAPKSPDPVVDTLRRYIWEAVDHFDTSSLIKLITETRKQRIIISDENLLGKMPGLSRGFYPRSHLLRNIIDETGRSFETTVLVQSRETSSYLKSCHKFRLSTGLGMDYAEFLQFLDLSSFRWSNLGKTMFDDAPYRTLVLPIEEAGNPSSVYSIFDAILPGSDRKSLPRENISIPREIETLALLCNRSGHKLSRPDILRVTKRWQSGDVSLQQALEEIGNHIPVEFEKIALSAPLEDSDRSLDSMISNYFKHDYRKFLDTYAQVQATTRSGENERFKPMQSI